MIRFKLKQLIAEKEFRDQERITLLVIAERANINRMTLSKMANNRDANITCEVLDKLCAYFGCRIEELIEYVPDTKQ